MALNTIHLNFVTSCIYLILETGFLRLKFLHENGSGKCAIYRILSVWFHLLLKVRTS